MLNEEKTFFLLLLLRTNVTFYKMNQYLTKSKQCLTVLKQKELCFISSGKD